MTEEGFCEWEFQLYRHWYESHSGHHESLKSSKLIGKKDTIVLEELSETFKVMKYNDVVKECYEISVNDLIMLIKKHGKKL